MHPDEDVPMTDGPPDETLAKDLSRRLERATHEAIEHERSAAAWRRQEAMCEAALRALKESQVKSVELDAADGPASEPLRY